MSFSEGEGGNCFEQIYSLAKCPLEVKDKKQVFTNMEVQVDNVRGLHLCKIIQGTNSTQ